MEATERLGWATGQAEASGQKSAFGRASNLAGRNASPIKGDVKRHFSPPAGRPRILSCIQPPSPVPVVFSVVGPLAPAARQRIPIPSGFMLVIVTPPFVFLKRTSVVVARLATMVLSETRGLLLSAVIRGGIG